MKQFAVILLLLSLGLTITGHLHAAGIIDTGSVELEDENGNPAGIDSFAGYYRLVFFGYTHCPDICPLTMYYVSTALKSLGDDTDKIKVLFISIDPRRDTPEVLDKYTSAFHPSIIGLTGSYDSIQSITSSFRTTFGYTVADESGERNLTREEYEALPMPSGYVPYHSSQIYLLDRDGELLDIIGYGSTPVDIADKIKEYVDAGD